jgi:NADH-quinone oxidoreductase subunit M
VRDLCGREVLALTPLVVFIVWIGLWPQFFLDRMNPTLDYLTAQPLAASQRLEASRPLETTQKEIPRTQSEGVCLNPEP